MQKDAPALSKYFAIQANHAKYALEADPIALIADADMAQQFNADLKRKEAVMIRAILSACGVYVPYIYVPYSHIRAIYVPYSLHAGVHACVDTRAHAYIIKHPSTHTHHTRAHTHTNTHTHTHTHTHKRAVELTRSIASSEQQSKTVLKMLARRLKEVCNLFVNASARFFSLFSFKKSE